MTNVEQCTAAGPRETGRWGPAGRLGGRNKGRRAVGRREGDRGAVQCGLGLCSAMGHQRISPTCLRELRGALSYIHQSRAALSIALRMRNAEWRGIGSSLMTSPLMHTMVYG